MIRKAENCTKEYREHMRDGAGTVEITNFIGSAEELNNKGRLFSKITLKPGCGIGYHVHENESELFYIIKGNAIYNDNGTEVPVSEGDVTICPPGSGHCISNPSEEVVELVALILHA
ncbi:MAG: cupin domain-containing protein [Eubacteriales bacterium]|nr:cupin domain-containing protein [Eubacteriales bacterium]